MGERRAKTRSADGTATVYELCPGQASIVVLRRVAEIDPPLNDRFGLHEVASGLDSLRDRVPAGRAEQEAPSQKPALVRDLVYDLGFDWNGPSEVWESSSPVPVRLVASMMRA